MRELYCELYTRMNDYISLHPEIQKQGLSLHIPMIGKCYTEQNEIRLMWIGRAINGWDDSDFFNLPLNDYLSKVEELKDDLTRFSWMKGYKFIRRSQFWRTCRLLHQKLNASATPADDWFEEIIWTNLYNVAPHNGGNPSKKLCEAQKQINGELLKKQIALFNPTHIVFVTDDDWFIDFAHLFPQMVSGSSVNGAIVRTGFIGKSKALVTKRPEYRFTDQKFTDAILAAFSNL